MSNYYRKALIPNTWGLKLSDTRKHLGTPGCSPCFGGTVLGAQWSGQLQKVAVLTSLCLDLVPSPEKAQGKNGCPGPDPGLSSFCELWCLIFLYPRRKGSRGPTAVLRVWTPWLLPGV